MLSTQRFMIATAAMAATCFLPLVTQATEEEVVRLHAVLKSDASIREKGVACKRLAVIGTKESIPVLAELLADDRLAHYARFGLEAIPDSAVDTVFRDALSARGLPSCSRGPWESRGSQTREGCGWTRSSTRTRR